MGRKRISKENSYEILSQKIKSGEIKPIHYLCGSKESKVATGFSTLDRALTFEIIGVRTPSPFRYSFSHVKIICQGSVIFWGTDLGQAYVEFLALFNKREVFHGNLY